jgi:hypothetical protein
MNIKRAIIGAAAVLTLAGGLAGGLAATASAAGSASPTISITGAQIYNPGTPSGVIEVTGSAQFSKDGTQIDNMLVFIDGVNAVYDSGSWNGDGTLVTLYGTYNEWAEESNFAASGRHVLTAEIIGPRGVVLATSPRYVITVP